MATYIPEDKLAEVRHAADIVEVISESVLLKKTGKSFVGLCPFHAEKTPSFTVSPDKQIFYCFGCGTGGNVFSFVMKRDGIPFGEAARQLARRGGIDIPERPQSVQEKKRASEQETLFEINRLAADFFHGWLRSEPGGGPARDYLARRGLTDQTIMDFRLGYAPGGWDNLLVFMARKKVAPAMLEKAGLVVPRKEGGGFYDRFRDRVIFPIYDGSARVVGFGGRVMDASTPKYLNSPETPVYFKRRTLYGLHRAREACRAAGSVFIVEGYLDLIALHQHGITNAVATLGTALSPEHVRLLTRYAGKIILVYDSDEAGKRAALRCIDIFWKEHVDFRRGDVFRDEDADTRILVLSDGHDPDSFLRSQGVDAFRQAGQNATGIITHLMADAVRRHGLGTEGKIRIVSEMLGPLSAINDSIARALYVKQIAERLGLSETVILERLRAHRPQDVDSRQGTSGPHAAGQAAGRFEQRIISMMLQCPKIIPEIARRDILTHFEDGSLKLIGESLLRWKPRSPEEVPDVLARVEDSRQRELIAFLAIGEEQWSVKRCHSLINQFVENRYRQVGGFSVQKAIEAAEQGGNEAEVLRLLAEKQKMAVRREKQKMSVLKEKE